jgi:hypothetical protein
LNPASRSASLDANIRCGDALLGVFDLKMLEKGIPDAAYRPLAGDDKETAKHFGRRNKTEREGQGTLDFATGAGRLPAAMPIAGDARALRDMPEDSPEEIALKRKRFEATLADPRRSNLRIAGDLYIAAFLTLKTGGLPANRNTVTIPTSAHVWDALAGRKVYGELIDRAQDLADNVRAFHWPLEFSDIMATGGFAVVLGNPPWEVMQLSEEEYFAHRVPAIAELAGAARKRAIAALEKENPAFFSAYQANKRRFEAANEFARASGRFDLTARGKINSYALFAELFASLTTQHGRAGVILPSGIATDATTAEFFGTLIGSGRLIRLISFENEEFIFPSVHHAFRFCLLVVGSDGACDKPSFAFFLRQPDQRHDIERNFTISKTEIARINPNTQTAPVFRSRADAELTAKIYARVPVLIDETKGTDGNPWRIEFRQGLFNMTSDSGLFRTAAQLAEAGFVRNGRHWLASEGLRRP